MLSKVEHSRYHRQMIMPEIGEAGQLALREASVLIVGMGGLGCPVATYLATAGVGRIGLIDDDNVSLSNLHRQVLFNESDVGSNKAQTAAINLTKKNSTVQYEPYSSRLTIKNVISIISDYDIIVDASDNFPTRYLINDACFFLDKPVVFGAVNQFEGQVSVFHIKNDQGLKLNYRDLFPFPPSPNTIPNCSEAGVLGALPGLVGSVQAGEVIKLICDAQTIAGHLWHIDALSLESYRISLVENAINPLRGNDPKIVSLDTMKQFYDQEFCLQSDVDEAFFNELQQQFESFLLVDVREPDEVVNEPVPTARNIPLSRLALDLPDAWQYQAIVFICQTGKRSRAAVSLIGGSNVYSLEGGVNNNKWILNDTRNANVD